MCNCLQRHISKLLPLLLSEKPHFQQKANLCICSSKVTGYSIMLISSGNIFGSTINPWRLLKCFLFCSSVVHICTHTHKHTYAHFPNSLSQHQKSGAILQFITSLSSFLSLFFILQACPDGLWGQECQFSCDPCENGGQCNEKTGNCDCPSGYTGKACTICKSLT